MGEAQVCFKNMFCDLNNNSITLCDKHATFVAYVCKLEARGMGSLRQAIINCTRTSFGQQASQDSVYVILLRFVGQQTRQNCAAIGVPLEVTGITRVSYDLL